MSAPGCQGPAFPLAKKKEEEEEMEEEEAEEERRRGARSWRVGGCLSAPGLEFGFEASPGTRPTLVGTRLAHLFAGQLWALA